MKKDDNIMQEGQNTISDRENDVIDLAEIFYLLKKNWYWFLITITLSFVLVSSYVRYAMPVYQTSATVLINEADRRAVENSDILQGFGLPGGMQNMENQILILKSRALIEQTLEKLPLYDIECYYKYLRRDISLYPKIPIRITSDFENPLPKDKEFSITYIGNNKYVLESEDKNFDFKRSAEFGEYVEATGGTFSIELRNHEGTKLDPGQKIYFIIYSRSRLINQYARRINVERLSRDGSILKISLSGTNRARDVHFINEHISGFQSISLDKKNSEAQRRIQFIDDQLVDITETLSTTETTLQQFRSSNRIMDLSAQGQSIIGQLTLLENERARLNLEANYYDYLADYLNMESTSEIPIVPITMGINDPTLTRLVEELAELTQQLALRGAGELNPLQRNLEQRVRATKDALRETLNGLRRANGLARSENQEQINRANAQASALPATERQLLGIERKFRLTDELYTFLLETRAEQEMQKASNRADCEVVDPADTRFSSVISPNRKRLTVLSLFAGLLIPILFIYLSSTLNKTLKTEDIKRLASVPIVGKIPHCTERSNNVVFDNPNSATSEAFRILRSRIQFFTKDEIAPVLLITSTMPEDGKTFSAINIAAVYSLLGKKTVLVGFDLRKPRIIQDFNLTNEKGVSTWLIGKDKLQDIIQETNYENLSIIPAGPIPPNPSELTALEKTGELIRLLKEKYEYIIIDSSPMGIVSDTYYLASLADACLLIVRPGHTLKDLFENTLYGIGASKIKGVCLVLNDIQSDRKNYGYDGKYGYTDINKRSRKEYSRKAKR